jgi:membrane associated rhomboid family serine protease
MLIPIGHEQTSVRRLPWVSFTIMGLCVVAWLLSLTAPDNEEIILDREKMALHYYFEHPYLALDEELKSYQYYQMLHLHDEQAAPLPPDTDTIRVEQKELDRLTARISEARDQIPEQRWGYIPTRARPVALISHMFMHAGFLHLLGNMFFFYLVGPYIEDVWGRPLFTAFYLAAGLVAVLGFAWKYPNIDEPLIGASGAVSGVMGAFMIRYWDTKITFFYTLFLKRWTGTFAAPAWLMLSLWFVRELLMAQGVWALMPGAAGNVAYWAHAFGFIFGVAGALAIKQLKVEESFVDRAIERQVTVLDNKVVDEAVELARSGRVDEAMQSLEGELARHPDNEEAMVALWNVALGSNRCTEVVDQLQPVIRRAARDSDLEVVRAYWTDMIRAVPDVTVDTAVAVRVVELLSSAGDKEEAAETVEWLTPRLGHDLAIKLLVRLARQADSLHLKQAAQLAEAGLRHPRITPELTAELSRMSRQAVAKQPPSASHQVVASEESLAASPPAPAVRHTATNRTPAMARPEVMEATPVALDEQQLTLHTGASRRVLRIELIRAIATSVIENGNDPRYLVIDLLLDLPAAGATRLRVVRLRSNRFNPQSLVGGDDLMSALKSLLELLLTSSGARAIPSRASVLGQPFQRHRSLAEHEQATF